MKYVKRIMAIMIVLALCLTSLRSSIAYAKNLTMENSLLKLEKNNYTYIKGTLGDTNVIYTYTSGDKLFKVIETASDNFDAVDSTIYVRDNDKFIEYATQKLTVEDDVITITINENGLLTTDTIMIRQKENTTENLPINQAPLNTVYSNPSWNGMPVSLWIYYGAYTGSSDVIRYTSAAVLAMLTTIVASFFGISGEVVVAGISAVAGVIIQDQTPRIWWRDHVYYQTCIPPEDWMFRMKVAEYTHAYIYSDSSMSVSSFIGDYYHYYYDSLYEH